MPIVSNTENLHGISNPVFKEKKKKKNIIYLLLAEFAQRAVKPRLIFILWFPRAIFIDFIYRIRPSYYTVHLGFSKLLGKLVVKYDYDSAY